MQSQPSATTSVERQLRHIRHAAHESMPEAIDDIQQLVEVESPSKDLAALARSARRVTEIIANRLSGSTELKTIEGVPHLRVTFGGEPQLLLLAHHDTVWPLGTLARLPFQSDGQVLRGPGVFDMKTGLVMAVHALRIAERIRPGCVSGVVLLVTGDEEVGSETSRELIESEARSCRSTLVLEAAVDDAVKVARKGGAFYEILIDGRSSHAGLEPERGINAGLELAYQALAVTGLSDAEEGTSVVPTLMSAGTTSNTVPGHAALTVDSRAWTACEQKRVDEAIRGLTAVLDGSRLTITGGVNRPPLERASSEALFTRASTLAVRLGLSPLTGAAVGGCSDGNYTAAVGSETLDGLGAVGGGAHAEDEHVRIEAIPDRIALLAALIVDHSERLL